MTGKLCSPKDLKKARRCVRVSQKHNSWIKTQARRLRRRLEKNKIKMGEYDFQGQGLNSWDLY